MEKRFFLAIILSFGVLYFWGLLNPNTPPQEVKISQTTEAEEFVEDSSQNLPEVADSILKDIEEPASEAAAMVEGAEDVDAKEYSIESDQLKLTFTDRGAGLSDIIVKEYNSSMPVINLSTLKGMANKPFVATHHSDNSVVFEYSDNIQTIEQSYKLNGSGYVLTAKTRVYNNTQMSKLITPEFYGYELDASRMDITQENMVAQRDKTLNEYALKQGKKIHRKAKAFSFDDKDEFINEAEVDWVAFRDRYFCAIIKPDFETNGAKITPWMGKEYMKEEKGIFGTKQKSTHLSVDLDVPEVQIAPGDYIEYKSIAYIGPEEISKLKPLGFGFEKVKKYYRFGLFDFAGKLINQIIHLLYKFIPNWGACIIILSVIVYFSMYPLTKKSMMSMRKMQAVGPKINAIKAKHKDNPQKLNAEMMEIYKKEKINPAGGCLPILLQMPIFLGLYQVLWRSVSFKGSKFLWIKDLTEPDRLFIMPFSLPVLGNEFNILPILMVVIMYFQQKFSTKNMVAADPVQAQQQKMMAIMMPFVLGFVFYKFSSGLTLYFTMFYVFSTATQWKMSREVKAS